MIRKTKNVTVVQASPVRPSWHDVFFEIAGSVAKRSTCNRLAVGAVIVTKDNAIVSTGFNGAPRGLPHCANVGCLMEGDHCVRGIHAELNAILQAARLGSSIAGCTLFTTNRPCYRCATAIIQVGLSEVYFTGSYDTDDVAKVAYILKYSGVGIVKYDPKEDVYGSKYTAL